MTVVVSIMRAGVMFEDGSASLRLSAKDFTDGLAWLTFYYLVGMEGGYCHTVRIYDRDGTLIYDR